MKITLEFELNDPPADTLTFTAEYHDYFAHPLFGAKVGLGIISWDAIKAQVLRKLSAELKTRMQIFTPVKTPPVFESWQSWRYDSRDDERPVSHYLEEVKAKNGEPFYSENYLDIGLPPFGQIGETFEMNGKQVRVVDVNVIKQHDKPVWLTVLQEVESTNEETQDAANT